MPRKAKLLLISIPLAGFLAALGAVVFSRLRSVPLPEATWSWLFFFAGLVAANAYLPRAIEAAWEEARRQGAPEPEHAAAGKQWLLFGLAMAAFLFDAFYVRDTPKPYNVVLGAVALIGFGVYGLWFTLTRHDALWEAYREARRLIEAGELSLLGRRLTRVHLLPFRMVYESYHWMPTRVLDGVLGALAVLIGAWGLWMEPTVVRERALGGDARWQFEAAELYFHGDLPRDEERAFALYLAAARQGYPKAYYSVGRMYYRGDGTARNSAEAARWFRKAADVGGLERAAWAWNSLGVAHAHGEGVELDLAEAVQCFHRAAAGGNPEGQANLGITYESGLGLPADAGLALYWYERAAAGDLRVARERAEALKTQGVRPKKPEAGDTEASR